MKIMSSFILISLLALAGSAFAADPEVKEATRPQDQSPIPTPNISINQAEIEAGTLPEAPDADKSGPTERPLSPMMVEIKAALDASKAQVAELSARASAAPDHDSQMAIHREVSQIKQQVELDILAIQARYAREKGDEALALQIEEAIDTILNPPAPTAPTEPRLAPLNR